MRFKENDLPKHIREQLKNKAQKSSKTNDISLVDTNYGITLDNYPQQAERADRQVVLDITPVAKPRMTQRDKWDKRKCVVRYREFCNHFRLLLQKHKIEIGDTLNIVFYLPMPKSWSYEKKMEYWCKPHKQKPDIDNLVKSVLDASFKDDSHVWEIKASKVWHAEGQIIIYQ